MRENPGQYAGEVMIVSIMQPYFFPYIGYFQLIAQSDVFVLHDDVQYIKGGWINRNRIIWNGKPRWLTLPVRSGASHLPINQRYYEHGRDAAGGALRRIEAAYRKAPRFAAVFPMLDELLRFGDANVAAFNANLLERLAAKLGLRARLVASSAMVKDDSLTGQDRVIDICRRLGATHYVNPIGGTQLYDPEPFDRAGVTLRFLNPAAPVYPQFGQTPVAGLSIIDVLMFNGDAAIARLLQAYRLLEPRQASSCAAVARRAVPALPSNHRSRT